MATENKRFPHPPLNFKNWTEWSYYAQGHLERLKMWAVVQEALPETPTAAQAKLDAEALAELKLMIGPTVIPIVRGSGTANEFWARLVAKFQCVSKARRHELRSQMNSLQKSPKESIEEYIARAREVHTQLELAGEHLPESTLVDNVVDGLPSSFQKVAQIIVHSRDDVYYTLEELETHLLIEESQLKRREEKENTALLAYGFGRDHGRAGRGGRSGRGGGRSGYGGRGGGGRGHGRHGGGQSGAGGYSDRHRDKICHHCHEKGHIRADCPQRTGKQGSGGYHGGGRGSGRGDAMALLAADTEVALMAVSEESDGEPEVASPDTKTVWKLDTAASSHMTPHRDLFITYTESKGFIGNANLSKSKTAGIGTVRLVVGGRSLYLRDVLHVPDFGHNLVSIPTLDQLGCKLLCGSGKATLVGPPNVLALDPASYPSKDPLARPLFTAPLVGKLYRLETDPVSTGSEHAFIAQKAPTGEEKARQLHAAYGHLGWDSLLRLVRGDMVKGCDVTAADIQAAAQEPCVVCIQAKHHRAPFHSSTTEYQGPQRLLHMDLMGPFAVPSAGGARYAATFLDEDSDLSAMRFLARKSDVTAATKAVLPMLENHGNFKYKAVRTDNGGEYVNEELEDYLKARGIEHQKTVPYSPQQNGKVERLNRTHLESTRAMLIDSGLPLPMWAEAMQTANVLRNLSPAPGKDKTPIEAHCGEKPDVSHLRPFGAKVYVHVDKSKRHKLEPVSRSGTFVGYAPGVKGYRILMDDTGKVETSRDVIFLPEPQPGTTYQPKSPGSRKRIRLLEQEEETTEDVAEEEKKKTEAATSQTSASSAATVGAVTAVVSSNADAGSVGAVSALRRSERLKTRETALAATDTSANNSVNPASWDEAMASEEGPKWMAARNEELMSLEEHNTYTLEPVPAGAKVIGSMWVLKKKMRADGSVERYKARVVARGDQQRPGRDFDELYAPVASHSTLRMLLAKAASEDLEVL